MRHLANYFCSFRLPETRPLPLVVLPVLGFPVLGFPVVNGVDGFAVEVCLSRGGEGIFAHAIFL